MKERLAVLGKEFVYGGHLLSLGASGMVLTVVFLLELPFKFNVLLIAYLISQIVYTYNHFREIEFDLDSNPERAKYIKKQEQWIKLLLHGYGLLLLTLVLFTNLKVFLHVLFMLTGGILYTDYFKKKIVKYILGSKSIYSSFFWGTIIFLVPFFYKITITLFFFYFFLFVFFRWMINTSFFDVKDIKDDKQRHLKTLPVVFGKKKTILLLQIMNLITVLPLILGVITHNMSKNSLGLIIFFFYGLYYLTQSLFISGKSLRNLSYIVVDAEYIFWPMSILIASFFLTGK